MDEEEHEVYGGEIPEEVEMEGDNADIDMANPDEDAVKKPHELDDTKKRLKEMEDEPTALREMQAKVEKEMGVVQGVEAGAASPELLSFRKLSDSLEKLLLDSEYDFSDAVIVVEGANLGVNHCILASRSKVFHELFKKKKNGTDSGSKKDGKPTYEMNELVPLGRVGYEAFIVSLNYVYTGKLKPPPVEVSIVELLHASTTFHMKQLMLLSRNSSK